MLFKFFGVLQLLPELATPVRVPQITSSIRSFSSFHSRLPAFSLSRVFFDRFFFSKQWKALQAQQKFIHVIDLADIPPLVARLKAFQVYAKAIAL